MPKRDIRMTPGEVTEFLSQHAECVIAFNDGRPAPAVVLAQYCLRGDRMAISVPRSAPVRSGSGVAAMLAMVASPEFNRFHKATPAIQPWHGIHVAPPAFAADKTPSTKRIPTVTTARLAQRTQLQQAKAAAPIPAPTAAAPAPVTPAPEVVAPVNTAVAADPVDTQDAAPPKKRFWSKLNVFKKKSAEPKDKP